MTTCALSTFVAGAPVAPWLWVGADDATDDVLPLVDVEELPLVDVEELPQAVSPTAAHIATADDATARTAGACWMDLMFHSSQQG